jgi:hypothetical protein
MKRFYMLAGCLAGLLLAGCGATAASQPEAQSLKEAVTTLVQHAQAGDTRYFSGLMPSPTPGAAAQLVAMVRRSGMLTNYTERLHARSPTEARLDYHYLEKGCHFQVSLVKENSAWKVKQIGLCR